jgi:hypothetical protein
MPHPKLARRNKMTWLAGSALKYPDSMLN